MNLEEFLKKVNSKVLIKAANFALTKSSKLKNIKINISGTTLEKIQKAHVNTLLTIIDKNQLAALIIQILQQASKQFLSINIDDKIDLFLKKCFDDNENEKLLRELIVKYYQFNSKKMLENLNDKIEDKAEVSLTNVNYFIVINDKLIKKNSNEEIQKIIKDEQIDSYVYGKYIDRIYLIDVESNIDAVTKIKQVDNNCKKIYKINEQNGTTFKIKRLAKRISR